MINGYYDNRQAWHFMTRPHADRSQCSEKSRFMDISPVRRLIRMTEKSRQIRQMPQRIHRKCVKRPSAVADWVTVTVTYGRPRLLGLPYVVERCRKILAVLCRKNLLIHITKSSRQIKYPSAATDRYHILTVTGGRQRHIELPYVFQCSEAIAFHVY